MCVVESIELTKFSFKKIFHFKFVYECTHVDAGPQGGQSNRIP